MSKFDMGDYVDVAARIAKFFEEFPDGSLQADPPEFITQGGQDWVLMRAYAYRNWEDPRPGIGTAWEVIPGKTPYTRGSEIQNCETSAWGRALAALGIETRKGIATRQDVQQAKARQAPLDSAVIEQASTVDELRALWAAGDPSQRKRIEARVKELADAGK